MRLFFVLLLTRVGVLLGKKSVLFLIADDLRPQLGAYGHKEMITPNMDKLASESVIFEMAYTNFAICSPSRNSFLSGRSPTYTRTFNFINDFRASGLSSSNRPGSEWTTLPEYFKLQNYTTLGFGKLFHPNKPPENDPQSWTGPYVQSSNSACAGHEGGGYVEMCTNTALPASAFSDVNTTASCLEALKGFDEQNPWFIGLGLHFPHLNWLLPAWTFDLYANISDPGAAYRQPPFAVPDIAYSAECDGGSFLGFDLTQLPFSLVRRLLLLNSTEYINQTYFQFPLPHPPHTKNNYTLPLWPEQFMRIGYRAAVTHSDFLFGTILNEVANKTHVITVLTGDHGYQLGELGEFAKHTNFENAMRVPLFIRVPGLAKPRRLGSPYFFELIDLYRTLAGLTKNSAPESDVEGIDQSPLILGLTNQTLRHAAYGQYSRCPHENKPAWYHNDCERVDITNISAMGYTIRTPTYRFTEWYTWNGSSCEPIFDDIIGTELYALSSTPTFDDPGQSLNLAASPFHFAEEFSPLIDHFRNMLQSRFSLVHLGCPPPTGSSPSSSSSLAAPDSIISTLF